MWLVKKKGRPFWYVRFVDPQHPDKRISLSTGETGKRAARARGEALVERYLRDIERAEVGGKISSLHVIERYWEVEASKLKAARTHVLPHLERISAFLGVSAYPDVTIADVSRFVESLDGKLSPSTINRAVSIWRRMHNVAAKRWLYPVHPIDWSQVRQQEPEPEPRALTAEEARRLIGCLTPRGAEIAMFGIFTGIRKAQILGLTWDRVDIDAGVVRVYRKHRRAFVLHDVSLHPVAAKVLRARHEAKDGDLVFDTTNHRLEWENAVSSADLGRDVRFHDLRHTYATWLAAEDPLAAKAQLGHSDLRVTNRYVLPKRASIVAAVSRIRGLD